MKKKLGVVLAALFTLTIGTTSVFAAGSPSPETPIVTQTTDAEGNDQFNFESVDTKAEITVAEDVKEAVNFSLDTALVKFFKVTDAAGKAVENVTVNLTAVTSDTVTEAIEEADVAEDDVLASVNISIEGFTSGTVALPLTVPSIKADDKVKALHVKADGSVEECKVDVIGEGMIVLHATSFSPYIFVKDTTTQTQVTPSTPDKTDDTPKAPGTGEMLPLALLLAVGCVAGAAYCAKKLMAGRA